MIGMKLILGLDIGIASVGYGIINENFEIITTGARLFSEGTAANNLERRTFRGTRRRIRRVKHRLTRMKELLFDVFGEHEAESFDNIYEIRCKGLRERLEPQEIMAAILHLTKRRGIHYLTADDVDPDSASKGEVAQTLTENSEKLGSRYICELQLEELKKTGVVRGVENKFVHQKYEQELDALLEKQSEYYEELGKAIEAIKKIYNSKREFFEGPGSKISPTPYGRFRYNAEGNVEEVNLLDLMRGKCTYFPDEKRMAKWSYTTCLFNLLNDLNNLTVRGNTTGDDKLSYEQKKELIDNKINQGRNITLNDIAKVCGVEPDAISGYREDKSGKAIFTTFDGYKKVLTKAKTLGVQDLIIGNRELVDTIADILTQEKDIVKREEALVEAGIAKEFAVEISKIDAFKEYHSLSKKAIELILSDLWHTNKNQMQLFTEAGLSDEKLVAVKGKELAVDLDNWIVSPVTKRSVNETVKVINALRAWIKKQYGKDTEFSDIVIEMAREKNSEDKKQWIKKIQKEQETRKRDALLMAGDRKPNGTEMLMLSLLAEQDWKCAYSLQPILVDEVFKSKALEIDHIIPRSISFSDARSNKVVVKSVENQKKKNRTPYYYFSSGDNKNGISYEEFKQHVLANKKFSRAKKANLLYEENPLEHVQDFINRNLVDTRYASRKVLNLLQQFVKANELPTSVKVINGLVTHRFRAKAMLDKDRDATYAHHAQDALIIAGMGNTNILKTLTKWNAFSDGFADEKFIVDEFGQLIDKETGEIITNEDMDAPKYIRFIKSVEKVTPKFSFKVDRKPNRQLYDQQIKSTRVVTNDKGKDEAYIVTKYSDIYNSGANSSGEKLKKKILEHPETLLMYKHDPKTFEIFKKIVDEYKDEKNPFAAYKEDHGKIRKYSKKGIGPEIDSVKFLDGKLGSHRVNTKQTGNHQSVFLQLKSLRVDVYLDDGVYKLVNVLYDMVKNTATKYIVDEIKYEAAKTKKKISAKAEFLFSLYRGEMISYKKDGELETWIFSCMNNDKTNCVEFKFPDKPSPGNTQPKRMHTIGKKITDFTKYHVDVLGNAYPITREKLQMEIEK